MSQELERMRSQAEQAKRLAKNIPDKALRHRLIAIAEDEMLRVRTREADELAAEEETRHESGP